MTSLHVGTAGSQEGELYTSPNQFWMKKERFQIHAAGGSLNATTLILLQMLRDKHGRKDAILFTNLNVLCELIRSCHLHTNAAPCGGVILHPTTCSPQRRMLLGAGLGGIAESVAVAESASKLMSDRLCTPASFLCPRPARQAAEKGRVLPASHQWEAQATHPLHSPREPHPAVLHCSLSGHFWPFGSPTASSQEASFCGQRNFPHLLAWHSEPNLG